MRRLVTCAVVVVATVGGCSSSDDVRLEGDVEVRILVLPEPTDGGNDMQARATLALDDKTGCIVDEESRRPVAFPDGTSVEGDRQSWSIVSESGDEFTEGDLVMGGGDEDSEMGGFEPDALPTECGGTPWVAIVTELGAGTSPFE